MVANINTEMVKWACEQLGENWHLYDLEQLRRGTTIEYEEHVKTLENSFGGHGSDFENSVLVAAMGIALDHLKTDPKYYSRQQMIGKGWRRYGAASSHEKI
jgi:hypothetical protein